MEPKIQTQAHNLIEFLNQSPSLYHATEEIEKNLKKQGYIKLIESDPWNLKPQKKYYVKRNNSSIISFSIPSRMPWETGFSMASAHTDSPCLKLKLDTHQNMFNTHLAHIEVYGGATIAPWLDRPLGVCGRVFSETQGKLTEHLYASQTPLATIPNLAIHMNRELNDGFKYNRHNHLLALFGTGAPSEDTNSLLLKYISKDLSVKEESIVAHDLFLYEQSPACKLGIEQELLSAPKIDNLASCHAICEALSHSKSENTVVGLFFDHEEVGSQTRMGADSTFARDILERITISLGGQREELHRALAKSWLLSCDGAHASHPAYAEKIDKDTSPELNKGPALKLNANHRYATSSEGAALIKSIGKKHNIPIQKLCNRADIPCGSTVGPLASAILGVKTIDIGHPMLAMHSIRETCGTMDHSWMIQIISEFYNL